MAMSSKLEIEMALSTLTEDLILEILLRLPAISLMRFRCVCKAWLHLIKSPNFIDMHLKHSSTKPPLILLSRRDREEEVLLSIHAYESLAYIDSFHLNQYVKICGPCNGLLCVLDNYDEGFLLCNPSTQDSRYLPRSPFPCQKGWYYHVKGFGFGFVSNLNDYKVVALVSFIKFFDESSEDDSEEEEELADKVEIYDLSKDSWREIECDCPYTKFIDEYGTLFRGSVHWTAQTEGITLIPSFNLSTEVFRDMVLPDDLLGRYELLNYVKVLNDCLALLAFTGSYYREQFVDIWVMREYGVSDSWTKIVSIGPLLEIKKPLMLWNDKAILLESYEDELVACDLDSHEIEKFGIQSGSGWSMTALVYHESLIPLN